MRARADSWLAGGAGAALGVAGVLILAGGATLSPLLLGGGGALAAIGVLVVVAGGWVEPLWLVILALPLPAPWASDQARLAPVLFASVVILAGWGLRRALDRRPLVPDRRAALPLAGVAAAVVVAAVFAASPLDAAREVVNFALLLGLFAVALDLVGERPERAHTAVRWIAIAAALAGLAAVPEALGWTPARFRLAGTAFNRAAGGFAWPNELAMFLSISFPFCVHVARTARSPRGRSAAIAGVGCAALGLLATFSRGNWLALGIAPCALLLLGERRTALTFWTVALLGALAVDVATGGAIRGRIVATATDVLVAQRLLLTLSGLLMFQAHPLLGVGPGGFGAGLDQLGLQVPALFDVVDSAQNGYVQMAAEAGVVGLAALLFFVGATLRALVRGARAERLRSAADAREASLRAALLWSFATAWVVALFEWPFAHGIGELIVVVAGIGVALAGREATS